MQWYLCLRVSRLRRRFITSGLSLFLVTFIFGYLQTEREKEYVNNEFHYQFVYIREGAAQALIKHLHEYYNVCQNQTASLAEKSQKLCPCLPNRNWVVSEEDFSQKSLDYSSVDADFANVKHGSWRPPNCLARQRIAVIIPAKNRDEHLHTLLQHLHPFLQSQFIEYSIYVVDQTSPSLYNKAASMNAAYLELKKWESHSDRPLNCVIFHDVDQIPMDNRNMYTCFYSPLHLGGYRSADSQDRGNYIDSFGGITSLSVNHFEAVNGYSNSFWGWGGEDANLGWRVRSLDKEISVYPPGIAQTYWLRHNKDSGNPINLNRVWDSTTYFEDGLNTLRYRLAKSEPRQLYTKFEIDLDPLLDDQKCKMKPNDTKATININCINRENIAKGHKYCCYDKFGAFCCGKSTFYQWTYVFTRSMEKYPFHWVLGVFTFCLVIALLWRTYFNRAAKTTIL